MKLLYLQRNLLDLQSSCNNIVEYFRGKDLDSNVGCLHVERILAWSVSWNMDFSSKVMVL